MPPSHRVAQPAMEERQRIIVNESAINPVGPGIPYYRVFHAAIEGLPAHAELARGLGHDVAVFGEHAFDGGPIEHRVIGARR